jgi:hypothetical protein
LLVERRYREAQAPLDPGHHLRTCGQPEWDAVDRLFFYPVHDPANDPVVPDAIEVAVFFAGAFSTDLPAGSHAPEAPINIIRGSNRGAHGSNYNCKGEFMIPDILTMKSPRSMIVETISKMAGRGCYEAATPLHNTSTTFLKM